MVLWRISRHMELSGRGGLTFAGRWHPRTSVIRVRAALAAFAANAKDAPGQRSDAENAEDVSGFGVAVALRPALTHNARMGSASLKNPAILPGVGRLGAQPRNCQPESGTPSSCQGDFLLARSVRSTICA